MQYKTLDLKDRGDVVVAYVKCGSILDQAVIDEIGVELLAATLEAAGTRKLLLNFRSVQFMSSAMLGKLVMTNKRCKADKIKLKLCDLSANISEVFTITGLSKVFDIQKNEAAAIIAFG